MQVLDGLQADSLESDDPVLPGLQADDCSTASPSPVSVSHNNMDTMSSYAHESKDLPRNAVPSIFGKSACDGSASRRYNTLAHTKSSV
jgi:hypothetical protein